MSKVTERITKIGLIIFLMTVIAPIISASFINGIVDFDGPRTIDPGIDDAFTYTVNSFQNYKITVDVSFNETVSPTYTLYVVVTSRAEWSEMLNGTKTLDNITDFLYNQTIYHNQPFTFNVIIPNSDEWTFIFFNPNAEPMLTRISITRKHIFWWLWIVIPVLVIIGLSSAVLVTISRRVKKS